MGEIERMDKVSELIGEPSWADAIAAIDKADDLRPEQKRHLSTSLRQMAAYLDKPLSMIPTRIAAVGPAVKKLHPARARDEPKNLRQSPGQCQDGAAVVQPTDARLRPHIIDGAALSIATGEGAEPLRVGTCCRPSSAICPQTVSGQRTFATSTSTHTSRIAKRRVSK